MRVRKNEVRGREGVTVFFSLFFFSAQRGEYPMF
jgi:hypothetical protein